MKESNYSEKFTALLSGLDGTKGIDPHVVHECIRKNGVVDQELLPMTEKKEEFFDASDITGSMRAKGQYWLKRHDYRHEWLWRARPANYIEILKDALHTSPIGVSVSAWHEVNGEYVSYGDVNNHYCLLYKIDDEGHPWVFDSYDHSKKKLSRDHNIRRAKRIWLNKRTPRALRHHVSLLQSIVNTLMNKKTLLDVCKAALGSDVTPKDDVPDEVACASTITTLLRKVYPEVPYEVSTIKLDEWLAKHWTRILEPEEGCIIISPTQGTRTGHVGVVMDDTVIASNTSFGLHKGKFILNYTITSWKHYYQHKLGLEIHYYKKT